MSGQQQTYASASLYVGDLDPQVSEALLFEIFNAVGPVASVRVCRDAATRRSLGYAYVNFHRVDDAELALDTMNFKSIRNKPCRIMWSHRDPSLRKSGSGNIFIKNLAKTIDNKILYDTFSVVGQILSCKVAMNAKGESLGYGFVHYQTESDAAAAIKNINGMMIQENKVIVTAFKSKEERGGTNKFKFTNVYVKNLPKGCSEEKANEIFGKHGEITSRMIGTDKENPDRVFGFVNFAAPEMAAAAVDALNGTEMDGKKLYVVRAQKKDEREKTLRDKFEQLKVERQKKYAGVNLYVKNLADDVDDEKLREEFAKFGSITSAKVMMDGPKSRGFGFVCFSTPEEATKAVNDMNGQMVNNKPLYVALAQRKEVRRAQLSAQHDARAKLGVPQPQMYPGPQQGAPMFYQPGIQQPRGNFVYQPQILPRARWTPQGQQNTPGGPQMMGVRPSMNYHLMPVQQQQQQQRGQGGVNGQLGGPQRGGPQQGNRRGGRGQQQQMNGPRVQQQQQGYKYTDNVRNNQRPPQQPQQPQPEVQPQAQQAPKPSAGQVPDFDVKVLAAASDEVRQRMIGERLFPLIKEVQPQLAGKITGMLLEMEVSEVLLLVTSKAALLEKIDEAMAVLQEAAGGADTETK